MAAGPNQARDCVKTQRLEGHENFFEHICPRTRFFDEVNGLRSPEFPEIGVFTQSPHGTDRLELGCKLRAPVRRPFMRTTLGS
jgi:hypothetical protein